MNKGLLGKLTEEQVKELQEAVLKIYAVECKSCGSQIDAGNPKEFSQVVKEGICFGCLYPSPHEEEETKQDEEAYDRWEERREYLQQNGYSK